MLMLLLKKINHIISKVQAESLNDVTSSQSTRKLWATVNSKYRHHPVTNPKSVTVDRLKPSYSKLEQSSLSLCPRVSIEKKLLNGWTKPNTVL